MTTYRYSVEENTRSELDTCCAIVCRLGHDARPEGLEDEAAAFEFVARVLIEERCTPSIFRRLDEKPGSSAWGGYRGLLGEWHCYLRRFRNAAPRELFHKALSGGAS